MIQIKQTLFETCRVLMIFGLMMTFGLQSAQAEKNLDEDTQKYLRINNNGNCAVNIYYWITSGDVFYTTINPGGHWDVITYNGHKWRAVDTDNVWNNLQYDQSYMVNNNTNQTWNITPNYCGNCTGKITGFLLNKQNGSALTALTNGMTFCESDFPNDIRIRTTESGSHESLKYTITGPGGTWTNTENVVTYDSEQFWANPGDYTVKAELYSHDNLGGTKCDESMISFTVNDCSNPCNNVTSGGSIAGNETQCLSYDPGVISNVTSPSGGSGAREYLWLSSTTGCPTQLSQAIPGATGATYNPGTINQTTYYVRCSRRAGCTDWTQGESNCVTKTVLSPPSAMAEGTNPTCGSNDGKITFFFTDDTGRTNIEFSIDGGNTYPYNVSDAAGSTMASNLGAGTYDVYTRWGNGQCPSDLGSVTLTSSGGDSDGDGVCDADDCRPNNPNISSPGDACNDGNANTNNDVIQGDCSCAGTPVVSGCDATYSVNGRTITINEIAAPITLVKIIDANWNTIYECSPWAGAGCGSSVSYTVPTCGSYQVQIQTYQDWSTPICNVLETVNVNSDCGGSTFDCPVLNADIGDACDDGNANTNNDTVNGNCQCVGTPVSTGCDVTITQDGNSIKVNGLNAAITSVKLLDQSWNTLASCDDWTNPCGSMELFDNLANGTYHVQVKTYADWSTPICDLFESFTIGGNTGPCDGQGGDADGDGVCANIDCNDNDASIGAIGSSCNDGNPNTNNDVINGNCQCVGTPINNGPCANNGGDADGDGVCADVDCNDNDASVGVIGSSCNDGNPNTNNDVINGNCQCAGTPISTGCNVDISVSGNSITVSGLTDAITSVKIITQAWATVATCDDWSTPCSATEVFSGLASGTYYVQVKTYADWSTPVCDLFETVNVGGGDPCAANGGDADGDGICANQDCNDFDANVGGAGSACDDGNPNTNNDMYNANCDCVGTVTGVCANNGGDADGDGVCADIDCNDNDASIGTIGSSCDDGNPNTSNDVVGANCQCAGIPGTGNCDVQVAVDNGKITVSNITGAITAVKFLDASWNTLQACDDWTPGNNCGSMEMYTATASGTYYVQVQTYADWSTPICDLFETVNITVTGPTCDNVTNGGSIAGDETGCGSYNPSPITSAALPSGGSGAIEYLWLASTNGCPTQLSQAIAGATSSTYNPGTITQTTYYRRCSRRAGCSVWTEGESNCIVKTVETCGPTVCADRNATSSNTCTNNTSYGIYTAGGNYYTLSNAKFVEYTDGTAKFTGHANGLGDIDVTFSGRTSNGTEKFGNCLGQVSTNDWYYYTAFSGTIGHLSISRRGEEFHIGTGGNNQNGGVLGGSGWWEATDGTLGDINIRLSGSATACAGSTNRIQNGGLDQPIVNQGIEEINTSESAISEVKVFPNPARETVNVSLKGYEGRDVEIHLINQIGKRVKIVNLENATNEVYSIDLNNATSGIYTVWIFTEGKQPVGKKMIVNKMY